MVGQRRRDRLDFSDAPRLAHASRLSLSAALSVIAVLAVPAAAFARPTLTSDRGCYAAELDTMRFTGHGFTPGAEVALLLASNGRVGSVSTTADPAGSFEMPVRAPAFKDFREKPPAFDVGVTANDQSKFGPEGPIGPPEDGFAAVEVRITEWDLDIPAWNTQGPARGKRGKRLKMVTTGWTSAGDNLYIHYLRGKKAVHGAKVGPLSGPCGDLTKTIKTFAFKQAKRGTYSIRFSTSPKWNSRDPWLGYRAVRLTR